MSVDVQVGQASRDTHCTTRDHCHGPTWAGIRLYKGAIDSQHECALGFHIRIGVDERFVTSGHCGFAGADNWLHPGIAGNHVLGAETGQTLYQNNGQDIMVVQLDVDAEASDNVFGCCGDIVAPYGTPIQGETLCALLAETNAIKCGSVTNTWLSWISDTPNPDIVVKGGDLTITTIDGDSGSPVYRRLQDPNGNQVRAIGVNAAEFGQFARLDTSLDDWGARIFP